MDLEKTIAKAGTSSNELKGISSMEIFATQLDESSYEGFTYEEEPLIGEGGWPKPYIEMFEQTEQSEDWPLFHLCQYQPRPPAGVQLLRSAINAARRIRAITRKAFYRRISIRWFEFDAAAPSGGVPELMPVNAREVAQVSLWHRPLLTLLALTVSNKRSLVFWSPRTNRHPGVLFTADSDLSRVCLPNQLNDAIATAPHHGSEANARAYAALAAAAQQHYSSITWVRSDGRFRRRPGDTFLQQSKLYCTRCRPYAHQEQAVHFTAAASGWNTKGTRPCKCV
jgi:hypothetical protein